jgi:hypothetical protein
MLAGLLALFAAAATSAPAPALPPKVVSPLTVTAIPKDSPPIDASVVVGGDDDNARGQDVLIWPTSAFEARANGYVTLTCRIDVHGLAEWCKVAFEKPVGRGFGKAALAMRPNLKIEPAKGPDGPIDAVMNIGIVFRAPDPQNNLQEVMANAMPGQPINASNLMVRNNPVEMRRVTMMNDPVWVKAPDFAAVGQAYPGRGGGLEGYAVAHCEVEKTGLLAKCSVAKELPGGHGFGKAAVELARQFRVAPEVMARAPRGAPVEVDVPIRFAPPGTADQTVNAPRWIAGFDPEQALRLFPPEAAAKGLTSGRGVAKCRVNSDGTVADCAPEPAEPDGLGFSEAAAKLASTLRMNLWSADAGPVEGGVVRVAIRLNLAGPSTPATR